MVAVVALAGYVLMQYVGSSAKTMEKLQQERPLDRTRLAADRATLTSMQSVVRNYQAEKGECTRSHFAATISSADAAGCPSVLAA